jgi:hypothetical protein
MLWAWWSAWWSAWRSWVTGVRVDSYSRVDTYTCSLYGPGWPLPQYIPRKNCLGRQMSSGWT